MEQMHKTMKIITKNLTGHLPNGDRYRIMMSNKKCSVIPTNRIVGIRLEAFNEDYNEWMYEDYVSCAYYKTDNYKDALKEALIRAENQFKIDLLKSEMQIAV